MPPPERPPEDAVGGRGQAGPGGREGSQRRGERGGGAVAEEGESTWNLSQA